LIDEVLAEKFLGKSINEVPDKMISRSLKMKVKNQFPRLFRNFPGSNVRNKFQQKGVRIEVVKGVRIMPNTRKLGRKITEFLFFVILWDFVGIFK